MIEVIAQLLCVVILAAIAVCAVCAAAWAVKETYDELREWWNDR